MIQTRQLAFGDTLRGLREEAGFRTGKEFAERLGWVPSKVSRVENGRTLPSDSDVTAWAHSIGAAADVALALRAEVREIRLERDRWKHQLRNGHAERQRTEAISERDATRIVTVELFLVPGLVQTPAYAHEVFELAAAMHGTRSDTEAAVRARIQRQEVLYDEGKSVAVLVGESALRYPICPAPVLRAQIDRLNNLSGLANVRLGIVPLDTPLPTITLHGYTLIDDIATVEVNHTELIISDPDDIDLYERITAQLWEIALEGEVASAMLAQLTTGLDRR
ncbi:helix-turn-helix domain-containing protein [Amycolatopsis sp. H20-H5]|uniref:helix-turn-helix domain-containing protein n=1 Tax=Amycolatopsis sp. H20-H5 TaxID=3046309 RepID=UPI002DB8B728|nr:helix-turn-helix transcriptional regulator [Amycolatopsis sp. H20-H5]MEC3980436.1 helix-turn-helix transcriptional regulator [Amycolatopsis sp. H20-H5]